MSGALLGLLLYFFEGVLWRCIVVALTGVLVAWLATGSVIAASRPVPARITPESGQRRLDAWLVPAWSIVQADPSAFGSRMRERLLTLAADNLAAAQISFNSVQARERLGPRVHDILAGVGRPPSRAEIRSVLDQIARLGQDSGGGGIAAVDDALAAKRRRRRLRP